MQPTTTFGSLLVTALSASFVAGTVIPLHPSSNFEVKRVANGGYTGRNGPLALRRAFKKWGISISDNLELAAENSRVALNTKRTLHYEPHHGHAKHNVGLAPALPNRDDLEYLVPVQIGTPPQTLNLNLDTGSADLWVFSSGTAENSTQGHALYTPDKSSTAEKLGNSTWTVGYLDGSGSSGNVYLDTVTVGGLSVPKQAVEAAKQVSSQFAENTNSDGILGTGFSVANTVRPIPQKTWFDNVLATLDSPLFVADLKADAPGSYIFGKIPRKLKNIYYSHVDPKQYSWLFASSSKLSGKFNAIADTGSTLIMADDDLTDAYWKQVTGARHDTKQGGYIFDCDTELPNFVFTVGDGEIVVHGHLMNYGPTDDDKNCYGGIQSHHGEVPYAIFGDVAFKAAHVIFDSGNSRIGWAQK